VWNPGTCPSGLEAQLLRLQPVSELDPPAPARRPAARPSLAPALAAVG
jgi:hypothetical protein